MSHNRRLLFTSVLLGFFNASLSCQAQTGLPTVNTEAAPLAVMVSPYDGHVRYEGRFDTSDPAGPKYSWSASAVTVKFRGEAMNVRLNDSNSDDYEVVVDGQPAAVLVPKGGIHVYRVFQAAKRSTHTVTLVKRTEAFFGTPQFLGFQLSQDGKMLAPPPRPARRIEVIGDSISCGYGNEAKDQKEHFSSTTENAYLSYGAVAARTLGAEYVCIAWSGRTMWPKNTMGEVYDRTLPLNPGSHWDFRRWTPDAVVINLSTNDFAGSVPDQKGWTEGYKAFLAHVRANYPRAAIYCATSPMLGGNSATVAQSYLTQIVTDENRAGDKNIRLLVFETQDGKNGFGADWHPSLKTDALMAQKMAGALTSDLGWEPAGAHR